VIKRADVLQPTVSRAGGKFKIPTARAESDSERETDGLSSTVVKEGWNLTSIPRLDLSRLCCWPCAFTCA
jgi:hypothetical protein